MQIKDKYQHIPSSFNKWSSIRQFVKKVMATPFKTKNNHTFGFVKTTMQQGFTLAELLVVTAILAIIAGMVITSYSGVQDQATHDATVFEMAELRKALIQFRRDSGSKNFPTVGAYACTDSDIIATAEANDATNTSGDTWPTGAPSADDDPADWQQWCQNPANFWMLFINPLDNINTTAEEGGWNVDTHRGWNGPYLQRNVVYLHIGYGLSPNGTGNPLSGATIKNIWGVASPYDYRPKTTLLSWYPAHDSTPAEAFLRYGTPYLLFDLDGLNDNHPARLVSLAADHDYDGATESDCSQPTEAENPYPLDHVLCLLK